MRSHRAFRPLCLVLLLAVSVLACAQEQRPLKEADILKQLASGAGNKKVAATVRRSGVSFPLTQESEERLRALGADDELIETIRTAAAARLAEESRPPLSETEILKGLAGGVSNQRMTQLVEHYGVDFALTPEREERLRAVGARDELIAAVRRAKPATPAGTAKVNSKDGLSYVWIPAGTFQMGCSPADDECASNEKPAHAVTLTNGFWMGQTETTNVAFQRVTGRNPSWNTSASSAVNGVTWDEANEYCTAVGMGLPTEAQWEYAARAGTTGLRYGQLDEIGWADQAWHDVATKKPNAWKLYDMIGNEEEWTADWYDEKYYSSSPSTDPTGPSAGTTRAIRDNGWYSKERGARASARDSEAPTAKRPGYGFRCAGANVP
jgi:formylglycine-generating enzyme required for sulfatase activity